MNKNKLEYYYFRYKRNTKYKIENTNKGFTLIELLITVALIAILLGAIWMVYDVGFRTFYTQGTRTSIKGEVGRLLINISAELRQATSLTSAQLDNLTFTLDSDSNGTDDNLQYIWSGTAGDPLNRILTSTTPPFTTTTAIVNSVNSLTFSYYDANNNPTANPSQVRLVTIALTVTDKDETFNLQSNARLRNL